MANTNSIIFSRRDYSNDTILFAKVAAQIQLLMEGGYICTIFNQSEKDMSIVIEFEPKNPLMGTPYPIWLLPDEIHALGEYQRKKYGEDIGPDELWDEGDDSNNNRN